MKTKSLLIALVITLFWSCDNSEFVTVNVATPVIMSKADFRNSVEILSPQAIDESGKIYTYGDYIFINDRFQGILIIDNTNPQTPQETAYIKIPGNIDITIKNNYLYADSSIDLVVFDISDIDHISQVDRLENVFSIYDYEIPLEAEEVN